MKPRHRVSRAAIEAIKRFEGYRRKAAQLPVGRWTIGYGHTQTARQGAEVSEPDAEALLIYDLIGVTHALNEWIYAPLNQNQFDALASFAFNIGLDAFRGSAALKRINEGALTHAAYALEQWRMADFEGERIVIDALVRRRASEKALFLTPPGGFWVPAPSAILKPELDLGIEALAPSQTPTPVLASLEGETVEVLRDATPPPSLAVPGPGDGPARTAAETVAARLRAVFQEEPETAEVKPQAHPERIPAEPHPQADFAPPIAPAAPTEPAADAEGTSAVQTETNPLDSGAEAATRRVLIDDTSPHEFVPPPVQPLPSRREAGLFAPAFLTVLGLCFLGGALFWGLNVAAGEFGTVNPRMVALLAGGAGVGFWAVAVYLFLERLGRAAERSEARRRR
jgi:lysozyme